MSGVNNTTQRPYTCKAFNRKTGMIVSVRLGPGFNSIPQSSWDIVKNSKFVNHLKRQGFLKFGEDEDKDELTKAGLTTAKVKVARSIAPKSVEQILKEQADKKEEEPKEEEGPKEEVL